MKAADRHSVSNPVPGRPAARTPRAVLLGALLLGACLAASSLPAAATMCSPAGGAPGPAGSLGDLPLGDIGGDASPIPGRSPADLIAELVGAGDDPPAAPGCSGPASEASAAAPSAGADGEPASLPPPTPGSSAGNPVDLVTGNKYARAVDVILPDQEAGLAAALVDALGVDAARALGPAWQPFAALRLAFTRHYNSRFDAPGPLGPGWRHGFETALARLNGRAGIELQVVQADGRRLVFRLAARDRVADGARSATALPSGQRFDGLSADSGWIDEQLDASLPWAWHWPDGRVLRFDRMGRLARIEAPDHDRLVLERDARGRLLAVRDASARSVRLDYADGRLVALTLPGGQRIRYGYDEHRVLTQVGYPDGRSLRYHYDDLQAFHLLTAIERPGRSPTRYRYDDLRRVVESRRGPSDAEALHFEWSVPAVPGSVGATRVREGSRNSTWHWRIDPVSGDPVMLAVEGEPCTRCPAGVQESSEPPGSAAGSGGPASARRPVVPRPLAIGIERDGFGLPAEARLSDGESGERIHLRWQRHQTGPLVGKLAWVERLASDGQGARTVFHHDPGRRLVAIEFPEGLVTRIGRDAQGRAVSWQAAGLAASRAGIDEHGRLVSWRNRGQTTRVEWQSNGLPAAIVWPAGDRWSFDWSIDRVAVHSDRGWSAGVASRQTDVRGGTDATTRLAVALAGGGAEPFVVDAAGRRTDFRYDAFGRRIRETSSDAGWRHYHYDAWGRIERIDASDGSVELRRHDRAGRLIEQTRSLDDDRVTTRLHWRDRLLVGVDHPEQSTRIEHDEFGRVAAIVDTLAGVAQRWTFERDDRGRISGRGLPDSSRVEYEHDRQGRPVAMRFRPGPGEAAISIVDQVRYAGGDPRAWRFGNGTAFERRNDPRGRPLLWQWSGRSGRSELPGWRYRWHVDGLPAGIATLDGERRLGWDALGRLIIDERHAAGGHSAEYFAWNPAGQLQASGTVEQAVRPVDAGPRDASGRVSSYRDLALHRGPHGRIVEVDTRSGPAARIARYAYNAAGERVFRETAAGRRGFLYRGRTLAAETDADGRPDRHYLRWMGATVAVIDRTAAGPRLSWLHGDHLGTPHAATDVDGRIVWQGGYRAFGGLAFERGTLRQPLRFAGQYHDPETGLYDNYQRSYDPVSARYLEPDPLGLSAGFDRFAYADGNPVLASDPLGLILFAFDGTNNAAEPPGRDDRSNVAKFFGAYLEQGWYMTGVGIADPDSGIGTNLLDPLDANTARARVDYMLATLEGYLDAHEGGVVDVDVIGFSRGAAMARDFANQVAAYDDSRWQARGVCLNLRFLGLWDTVAQFGLSGSANRHWQLGIPSAVGAVFHAVALNEHRTLFPLELAVGPTVIERGFIGSHADVGGGNAEGDLSDISLAWMVEMGRRAGLPLTLLNDTYLRVDAPILHDRDYDGGTDRLALRRDAGGTVASIDRMRSAPIGGMNWAQSQAFVVRAARRMADADGNPSIIGEVDLAAYLRWLETHYDFRITAG
ncbi:MAG: RHS repeat-associated core domain-containing protein [Burkholderiaceae bacterium]